MNIHEGNKRERREKKESGEKKMLNVCFDSNLLTHAVFSNKTFQTVQRSGL